LGYTAWFLSSLAFVWPRWSRRWRCYWEFSVAACRVFTDGYQAVFPSNYEVFREEGTRERFVSQQAVGPRNSANSYSAGISVTVAPEAVGGGEFDEPADRLKYLLKSMKANAANFSLTRNDVIQLDGVPANRVLFSYDIPNGISRVTHLREEVLFAKRGSELYTIVFSVDESEWASRRPEYDAFLNSFRWRR